ncbi:glycosyltransferase family 39 protein [Thermomicrobiaceae bacterium CFH 74404]|uniref:Glycosyltransferase family 39 protein n=1 Tax=Thermalbibacter longus TaxID=2951981 RepID=A0AA42B9N6_9BACT|nr:glycosyltransferase family 39 protein [Thermalbibacter longus]MCM8748622.1 glycosyltransferase family 39 protein [Thermalbibacter longus]
MTQATPARERAEASVLDRRIDLTRIDREALAWTGLLGLALLVRLVGLTNYPLSPAEAQLASDGLALVRGDALSSTGQAQPLPALAAALALFLFGAGDGVIRLVPLLAGLLTLLLIARLRIWLGPGTALAAGLLMALSPALVATSTRLDGGALLLLAVVATLAAATRFDRQPGAGPTVLLGFSAALLPLAHPLGWLVLAALALWGLWHRGTALFRHAVPLVCGMLGTLLLASTALLSRPGGALGFLEGSLSLLAREHVGAPLEGWPLPLALLVTDELPATLLALAALVGALGLRVRSGEPLRPPLASLAAWTGLVLLAALLLGGKGPALYGLLALPLALLGGVGLHAALAAIDWRLARNPWDLTVTGSATTLLLAVLSLLGRLLGGSGGQAAAWLAGLLVLLLIVLGLAALTAWLWRQAARPETLFLTIPLALLLALGLRSSLLLNMTNTARPGELLTAGATSPGVRLLVERVTRLSRDVTTFQSDVRDPTGGHGLAIAVDPALEQPFRWYFRDFPNVQVVSLAEAGPLEPTPDVIIAPAALEPTLASTYPDAVIRLYPLRSSMPEALANPDWQAILSAPVDPWAVRRYLSYLIDRQVAVPPAPESFALGLRAHLAERLYGPGAP